MSKKNFTRRDILKIGAAGGAATLYGRKALGQVCTDTVPVDIATASNTGCAIDADLFPTSPFITTPFVDALPVPKALAPGYRNPDGTLAATQDWTVRQKNGVFGSFASAPGPGAGQQDSIGDRPMYNDGKTYTFQNPVTGALTTKTLNFGGARAGTHQLFPGGQGTSYPRLAGQAKAAFDLLNATPIQYHIRLQVAEHAVTSSDVQPIDANGNVIPLPPGAPAANGTVAGTFKLPPSTIYGFNGTFPGPMINFEYGRPAIVRFENDLDLNPRCLTRQDFGAPDWAFLTHLHNGHTAPESDGQPNHMQDNEGGYQPGQWCDNLYLGYAAGGDDAEKQSFLWFHDHRMHHTGPNVYKGMVGLMPHYDPATPFNPTGIDSGDETTGLRLPGVRVNNPDGTFDVQFDIPMALYDCRMDNGTTPHEDDHQPLTPQAWSNNVCGQSHPEWWGRLFLQHYPNHGFVGDIFTVNGVAYPVLSVERRHYRFRFLGASLSRQYLLSLRTPGQGNTVVPARGRQGQWSFGSVDSKGRVTFSIGQQVMKMTQIASEGGLLPNPILRDAVEIWPAKRREVVIDFATYMDGSKTKAGDVVYLTNTAEMTDGRQITSKDKFAVPLVKFVIASNALAVDNSDPGLTPVPGNVKNQAGGGTFNPNKVLRPRHTPPFVGNTDKKLEDMDFTLQRGGSAGGETEWLINSLQFDPLNPLWAPTLGSFELWGINNGGGGWTHPMHIHMEEHQVVSRTAPALSDEGDPIAKADVVALQPSEQTQIYRGFRTFLGNYVAHCHNLAHEDHNMMFGWSITL
jgi:FtsP/CotA-like multicopper oxidase with cupredoxin domain